MKKIVFISHDASRTGAPLLLLWLIRWLKQYKNIQPYVLLLNDGVLKKEFEAVADTYLWQKELDKFPFLIRQLLRFGKYQSRYEKYIIKKIKIIKPDYLYFNSAGSANLIPLLKYKIKCPTLLHIHEYETIIQQININGSFSEALKHVDQFITVSEMVNQNLLLNHAVKNDKITVVYEYIDFTKYKPVEKKSKSKNFIIGGGGLVHWRKGVEFFMIVAKYFTKQNPGYKAEFWWIGSIKPYDRIYLEQDIKKLGLEDVIVFKGEIIEVSEILNEIDIFLITSREDPFPVIAIEAAYHYNPLITWNQAIGTKELVDKGCGFTVDYMDFESMADAILRIISNKELYKNLSTNSHLLAKELSLEKAGNEIFQLLEINLND